MHKQTIVSELASVNALDLAEVTGGKPQTSGNPTNPKSSSDPGFKEWSDKQSAKFSSQAEYNAEGDKPENKGFLGSLRTR